ncbi:MAG: FMN-binding negative transcriptional regulator [Pseudomonadota bacterium]
MHPNPAFRGESRDDHLTFARARAFGTLAVNAEPAPLLAHIPFLIAGTGESADLHLVRSNPIARLGATAAVLSVTGPDGYVSPDWYGIGDQVPTWNYVAVHLRGRLEPLPHGTMRDMLDRQSAHFEEALTPKLPWTTSKMTPKVLDRMMRQILPFRLHVEEVTGTWKLNQNKDDTVRLRAADRIEEGAGSELGTLARLMRDAAPKR